MQIAQELEINGTPIAKGPLPMDKFNNLSSIINQAVPILFSIAGIALFIYLVWGGFDYLMSMGDPKKAEAGKNKITHAVVGFIIMFSSYWILQIVDALFGFNIYK
ncbi:hypothetical protein HY407_03460 [Candidatus Gottesmanbacteria bacterium]|nr:hypothetical protein [Candidatus Gottesmanbacteria bacterium]